MPTTETEQGCTMVEADLRPLSVRSILLCVPLSLLITLWAQAQTSQALSAWKNTVPESRLRNCLSATGRSVRRSLISTRARLPPWSEGRRGCNRLWVQS